VFAEYAEEYRDWAGQCFAMACPTEDAQGKAEWLELALKWQRVAKQADRYAQERGKTWFPLRSPLIGVVHDASGSLDASPPCFRASRRRMRDRKRPTLTDSCDLDVGRRLPCFASDRKPETCPGEETASAPGAR
jgi:hypothetical protein